MKRGRSAMDIVFASHTVIGGHFVVGSHHLARSFAAAGHRVAHMSTPISPAHLALVGKSDIIRQRYRVCGTAVAAIRPVRSIWFRWRPCPGRPPGRFTA